MDTDIQGYARAVASQTDRVTIAVHRVAAPLAREAVRRAGLTGLTGVAGTGLLVPLMTALLGEPRPAGDLHAIERYVPWPEFVAALDEHVRQGVLERRPDGLFAPTGAGRRLLVSVQAAQGTAITGLWERAGVEPLLALADRLAAAAWESAGTAYATVAAAPDPPGATPAHLLLTRVTALRYHRADAHAAAWLAAGFTAERIRELRDGPQRERVECDTDRRAGAPYLALTATERRSWLDGLRALPG